MEPPPPKGRTMARQFRTEADAQEFCLQNNIQAFVKTGVRVDGVRTYNLYACANDIPQHVLHDLVDGPSKLLFAESTNVQHSTADEMSDTDENDDETAERTNAADHDSDDGRAEAATPSTSGKRGPRRVSFETGTKSGSQAADASTSEDEAVPTTDPIVLASPRTKFAEMLATKEARLSLAKRRRRAANLVNDKESAASSSQQSSASDRPHYLDAAVNSSRNGANKPVRQPPLIKPAAPTATKKPSPTRPTGRGEPPAAAPCAHSCGRHESPQFRLNANSATSSAATPAPPTNSGSDSCDVRSNVPSDDDDGSDGGDHGDGGDDGDGVGGAGVDGGEASETLSLCDLLAPLFDVTTTARRAPDYVDANQRLQRGETPDVRLTDINCRLNHFELHIRQKLEDTFDPASSFALTALLWRTATQAPIANEINRLVHEERVAKAAAATAAPADAPAAAASNTPGANGRGRKRPAAKVKEKKPRQPHKKLPTGGHTVLAEEGATILQTPITLDASVPDHYLTEDVLANANISLGAGQDLTTARQKAAYAGNFIELTRRYFRGVAAVQEAAARKPPDNGSVSSIIDKSPMTSGSQQLSQLVAPVVEPLFADPANGDALIVEYLAINFRRIGERTRTSTLPRKRRLPPDNPAEESAVEPADRDALAHDDEAADTGDGGTDEPPARASDEAAAGSDGEPKPYNMDIGTFLSMGANTRIRTLRRHLDLLRASNRDRTRAVLLPWTGSTMTSRLPTSPNEPAVELQSRIRVHISTIDTDYDQCRRQRAKQLRDGTFGSVEDPLPPPTAETLDLHRRLFELFGAGGARQMRKLGEVAHRIPSAVGEPMNERSGLRLRADHIGAYPSMPGRTISSVAVLIDAFDRLKNNQNVLQKEYADQQYKLLSIEEADERVKAYRLKERASSQPSPSRENALLFAPTLSNSRRPDEGSAMEVDERQSPESLSPRAPPLPQARRAASFPPPFIPVQPSAPSPTLHQSAPSDKAPGMEVDEPQSPESLSPRAPPLTPVQRAASFPPPFTPVQPSAPPPALHQSTPSALAAQRPEPEERPANSLGQPPIAPDHGQNGHAARQQTEQEQAAAQRAKPPSEELTPPPLVLPANSLGQPPIAPEQHQDDRTARQQTEQQEQAATQPASPPSEDMTSLPPVLPTEPQPMTFLQQRQALPPTRLDQRLPAISSLAARNRAPSLAHPRAHPQASEQRQHSGSPALPAMLPILPQFQAGGKRALVNPKMLSLRRRNAIDGIGDTSSSSTPSPSSTANARDAQAATAAAAAEDMYDI